MTTSVDHGKQIGGRRKGVRKIIGMIGKDTTGRSRIDSEVVFLFQCSKSVVG